MSGRTLEEVDGWAVGKVLLSEEQIADRVTALADEISGTYAGMSLTVVSILKGSYIFLADLTRKLSTPVRVDFLGMSSYAGTEAGPPEWTTRLTTSIAGHHVLLVEDIADTGRTLLRALPYLRSLGPASVRICALLNKPARREVDLALDFVGFTVGDDFVVGYGLDVDGWFRQLPYIALLSRAPAAHRA